MKKMNRFAYYLMPVLLIFSTGTSLLAQLPVCDGVTNMYGVFINPTSNTNNTYVAPVNFNTGAVGTKLTPGNFTVNPFSNAGFEGPATLAVSPVTRRFYYMTREYGDKRLFTYDSNTGTRSRIQTLTAFGNEYYVKMAMSQAGFGYMISTERLLADSMQPARLVRFTECNTGNTCSNVITLGFIDASVMPNYHQFNGDIAFDNLGDLYIFGSRLQYFTATGTTGYSNAYVYRIRAANIPTVAGTGTIPVEFLGEIPALYGVVISGAAFDGSGRFFLGSANQTAGTSTMYSGNLISSSTAVSTIGTFGPIDAGFFITDFASCTYPNLTVLNDPKCIAKGIKINTQKTKIVASLDLEKGIQKLVVERKLGHQRQFEKIAEDQSLGRTVLEWEDPFADFSTGAIQYRIALHLEDGRVVYSNTLIFQPQFNQSNVQLRSNSIKNQIDGVIQLQKAEHVQYALTDMYGHQLMQKQEFLPIGQSTFHLEVPENISKGIYLLQVQGIDWKKTLRIIKQ
jgi:hypothetical protein